MPHERETVPSSTTVHGLPRRTPGVTDLSQFTTEPPGRPPRLQRTWRTLGRAARFRRALPPAQLGAVAAVARAAEPEWGADHPPG